MSLFLAFLCFDEVDIYSGSSSSAEYDGRWSPHSGCLWIDDWWKLYFHVPQWVRVGLVWARRMCPGCQGYGQHLPRPPVHPLLHGVFPSVSLLCLYLSEEVLFYLITMHNSVFCFFLSVCRQYYSSCRTGNMDSALSIWFLLLWLGGDSCNLVGSFLADQLPLQVT